MKLKRTILGPVIVTGIAFFSGGWLLQGAGGETRYDNRLFQEVMSRVSRDYVEPHSESKLYEMAVEGMLEELGDPHTTFMSAEEYNELRVQTTGEYGGLGIQIAQKDGWVTVLGVLPETPAERAGLMPGDRIVEVEGKSTEGWTDDQAVKVLRGPKGTSVEFKVARIGVDQAIPYRVPREEIRVRSVRYAYQVEPGIGLARLDLFSETSTEELRQAIAKLKEQGMKGLILDLRSNPGGLLDQGISVSNLFLPPGKSIVETRGRDPRVEEKFAATRPELFPGLPIVVLVDDYSASAAEIVAGALQDHDRAVVVGVPTFGKGSVQSLFPLSGGNFLKMTTGLWYTPSGRSIQKEPKEGDEEASPFTEEAVAVDGRPVAAEDTVKRKAYKTAGGRTVYGGGGIVPDLLVRPDTLTEAEKTFFTLAAKGGSKFNDVIYRYALEYGKSQPRLDPNFEVTPEMLSELFNRLRAAGIEASRAQFDAASRPLRERLGYEIAQSKFGPNGAAQRANRTSPLIRTAVELLRGAESEKALFQRLEVRQR